MTSNPKRPIGKTRALLLLIAVVWSPALLTLALAAATEPHLRWAGTYLKLLPLVPGILVAYAVRLHDAAVWAAAGATEVLYLVLCYKLLRRGWTFIVPLMLLLSFAASLLLAAAARM